MDRAGIEARVNAGLGMAAQHLGGIYQVFRPSAALTPLEAPIFSLQAVVSADAALRMRAPAVYGDALRYLIADASSLQCGDVLVGEDCTLFVAALEAGMPALLVDCNQSVRITSLSAQSGYGGAVEQTIADGWPCSMRFSSRAETPSAALPGDVRGAGFQILLPAIPGVVLGNGMRMVDGGGQRWLISGVELTALGYRIQVVYGGV